MLIRIISAPDVSDIGSLLRERKVTHTLAITVLHFKKILRRIYTLSHVLI